MNELTFDQIMAEATLAEVEVPLCLSGKLRGEYAKVAGRIAEVRAAKAVAKDSPDDRLATKRAAVDTSADEAELERIAAEMAKYTVTFRLRAMSKGDWNEMWAKHPPRRGSDGRTDPRDATGFNSSTFWPEAIRKSIVTPELSDAQWNSLNTKITDVQFDKLGGAVWLLNRHEDDIPLPLAA